MNLKNFTVIPIHDAFTDVDPSFMFKEGFNKDKFLDMLTPEGKYRIPIGGYLIKAGSKNILVDVGQGLPVFSPDFGHYMENLSKTGVSEKDISAVVFTHLHVDHIGWCVFPNAKYYVHKLDLDYFLKNDKPLPGCVSVPERLKPIMDKIIAIEKDTEICPGVTLKHAPGHTPGELVIEIVDGSQRVLLLGDVLHHPAEYLDDSWIFCAPGSDFDQAQAIETRKKWFKESIKPNTIITAAHFPNMQFGRIEVASDGTRKWIKA